MKLIIAIIQPEELPAIKEELLKHQITNSLLQMPKARGRKSRSKKYTAAFPMK